ncbi:hypothetical protein [Streptomyces sp. NPDC053367]|uniref:hypothetical protein n=1 Tax=Streptomyces sp. NPDC053367 TaxID=3365700 RepID=UPI0037CFA82E
MPGALTGRRGAGQVPAEEWHCNHGIRLVAEQATGRILYARLGPRQTPRAPGAAKDAVVPLDVPRAAHTAATQRFAVDRARHGSALLRA